MNDGASRRSISALALAASAFALSGCRSESPAPAGRSSAPAQSAWDEDLPAYVADAPADPAAFVEWAWDALQRETPPIAPLAPAFAPPRWNVVHLAERVATGSGDAVEGPTAESVLLSRGPYDSREATPDFRCRFARQTIQRGARLWRVEFLNLGLRREQVGRIDLVDLELGDCEYLQLAWQGPQVTEIKETEMFTPAAWVRVPVKRAADRQTLQIPTDGLPFWSGPLDYLYLEFEEKPDAPLRLGALRLLGRTEAFSQPIGVCRVALDGHLRNAIHQRGGRELRIPEVVVPPDGRFQSGIGLLRDEGAAPAVETGEDATARPGLEVAVQSEGQETVVLSSPAPSPGSWSEVSASLAPWAGRSVELVLRAPDSGVALWGAPVVYQPVENAPRLILYLIDTLTSTRMGLYGYQRPTTPRIAAFAEHGVWFQNMRSNSPMTVISVKDMLLSAPAVQHGAGAYSAAPPEHLVPFPQTLLRSGFATAMFSTNVVAGPREKSDRGFESFFDCVPDTWGDEADRTVPIEQALAWLDQRRDRPTLAYIHTAEPHAPFFPPPGFAGRFAADYHGPVTGSIQSLHQVRDERDIEHARALYDEEVLYADHRFGLFIDALERAGMLENAHILITADHGEQLFEHGDWGHGVKHLFEEVLRVPLVLRGPQVTRRGRIDFPAQTLDIAPTLLAIADVPAPTPLAGENLMPIARGEADDRAPRDVVSCAVSERKGVMRFVINEHTGWKLICGRATTPGYAREVGVVNFELFYLPDDPFEQNDRMGGDAEAFRRLVAKLLRYKATHPPSAQDAPDAPAEFDAKQLRELRSLGYVP